MHSRITCTNVPSSAAGSAFKMSRHVRGNFPIALNNVKDFMTARRRVLSRDSVGPAPSYAIATHDKQPMCSSLSLSRRSLACQHKPSRIHATVARDQVVLCRTAADVSPFRPSHDRRPTTSSCCFQLKFLRKFHEEKHHLGARCFGGCRRRYVEWAQVWSPSHCSSKVERPSLKCCRPQGRLEVGETKSQPCASNKRRRVLPRRKIGFPASGALARLPKASSWPGW